MIHAVRHKRAQGPSERRTPVVTHDVRLLHADRIEDPEHVADQIEHAVALDLLRLRRLAEPA